MLAAIIQLNEHPLKILAASTTRAKIYQVDATLFVEQRLNNVVIMVQQNLLN